MSGSLYFKGRNVVGRFLRALNIVEPGDDLVISISKTFLWLSIALFAWTVVNHGDLTTFVGAVGALLASLGHYAWRRQTMLKNGRDPYESEKDHGTNDEAVRHSNGDGNHSEGERRADGH